MNPKENDWQIDPQQATVTQKFFAQQSGFPGASPRVYESFIPRPAMTEAGPISAGLIEQSSPYGDSRRMLPQQTPQLVSLTHPWLRAMAPPPQRGAELQPEGATPGFTQKGSPLYAMEWQPMPPPKPLGMAMGVGARGRNVPRPS